MVIDLFEVGSVQISVIFVLTINLPHVLEVLEELRAPSLKVVYVTLHVLRPFGALIAID